MAPCDVLGTPTSPALLGRLQMELFSNLLRCWRPHTDLDPASGRFLNSWLLAARNQPHPALPQPEDIQAGAGGAWTHVENALTDQSLQTVLMRWDRQAAAGPLSPPAAGGPLRPPPPAAAGPLRPPPPAAAATVGLTSSGRRMCF